MTDMAAERAEYWVLKVLRPEAVLVLTKEMASELECVAGELCEPVDWYPNEADACARAVHEHRRTGSVHKVVLSVPLPG